MKNGRALFLIGYLPAVMMGCALSSMSHSVEGYETQKRIVWQGTLTADADHDIVRMIFFGYDRNGDMVSLTEKVLCRGVDLLEYKGLLPNGRWAFDPIMVFSDDNFDCYADRVLYDCDADGTFEKVVDVREHHVKIEYLDDTHRAMIEADCLRVWRSR